MKYMDVRFRQPDWMLHPMQEFIREEDAVHYEEILTWRVSPDREVEYALYYVEAEMERYREVVRDVESVVECRIEQIDERSAHVWACDERQPEKEAFRSAFVDRDLVVVPPIRFDEEAALELTVVGDGEAMHALLADVPTEVDVTVNEVGTYDRRGGTLAGALTDRQLTAVTTALRMGYYEVPRGASLADVADALECAESTASLLLRRAERAVLSRVFERYGGSAGQITPGATAGERAVERPS